MERDEILKELGHLPKRLQEASERLNTAIAAVHSTLAELSLGVEATVDMGGEERLSYRRQCPDRWSLHFSENGGQGWRPLCECRREIRARALSYVPDLVKVIRSKAETILDSADWLPPTPAEARP